MSYYLSIWYAALEAEVGIEVRTDKPSSLRNKLYAVRQEEQREGNTALDNITLFEMPEGALWLVKQDVLQEWRDEHGKNSY